MTMNPIAMRAVATAMIPAVRAAPAVEVGPDARLVHPVMIMVD